MHTKHSIATLEECNRLTRSSISYEEKIGIFAAFLSNAEPDTSKELLDCAMECLVHLQFRHRNERGYGIIVTGDEYWAIRNVVWNIDKGIFWNAIGKRMVYLFNEKRGQWVIFNDETNRWEGYDAVSLEKTDAELPGDWLPWEKAFNDDYAPDFRWFEGAMTNLSFNSLDRYILEDPDPHYYRYWENESWGEEEPEETLRLNHREYLFEVTKTVMALKNLGVQKQDKAALLMPEVPGAYYLIEAFHRMGVVYTSLPTSLGDQQVSDRIDNLGVKYVFTVAGGWHKGKMVYYKKELLDKALSDFSGKDYFSGQLEELSDKIPEHQFHGLINSFEKNFGNRVTINKKDLLQFIRTFNLPSDIFGELEKRLASGPDRVSKVVVQGKIDDNTPMKRGRDTGWNEQTFMGNSIEEEILSFASKTLGTKISRQELLDYKKLDAQEFLRIIHHFAAPEIVEGDYPRLVIYTSGSTGIPKGVVHRTLGHGIFGMYTMLVTMGPRKWDLMDTRATHSWITGLDYIAGMPGLLGIESIVAEGAFDYERWLKRLSRLKVNIAKAGAPLLRGLKSFVEEKENFISELDLSSVRICVNCAEPADQVTQSVVNRIIGENKYVNTWWPTELTGPNTGTGSATVPFPFLMKHDASTFPLPYVKQDILSDEIDTEDNVTGTTSQETDILGRYVIDPHPGMLMGIFGDAEKFHESYFKRYWNKTGDQIWYDSGDGAIRRKDGYFHIIGRVGYAFNWNGHISGAEDVEGTLRDHPAVKDVMIAPIKNKADSLDRLQVFIILNEGYELNDKLRRDMDDFVVRKKQKTFKGLMTRGSDYYNVNMYPVTMSQKSLRRFGSMLGSLSDKQLSRIIRKLNNAKTMSLIEAGDETAINDIFPTKRDQNPYAGSLVGLGNYPSLVHLTHVVAETRGVK